MCFCHYGLLLIMDTSYFVTTRGGATPANPDTSPGTAPAFFVASPAITRLLAFPTDLPADFCVNST